MTKRELVFAAFDNQETERVPVGFWFHFAPEDLHNDSPEVLEKNQVGHLKFYHDFQPDFVKLMSDGLFTYPNPAIQKVRTAEDLKGIHAGYGKDWIDKQVRLVSSLTGHFGQEVATFYNVFAPATYLKWQLGFQGLSLGAFADENPEAVREALDAIAEDVAELARAVIRDGKADGIYLSVQNLQDSHLTKEAYQRVVAPSEKKVLEAANELSSYNILHICGYHGARNDLSTYVDYPAKVINWAVVVEGVSLEEGKKLFGGRAVLGGFANTENDLLYRGTEGEIKTYTTGLLANAGTKGVILGADCTVPGDIDFKRLEWVREAARDFSRRQKAAGV